MLTATTRRLLRPATFGAIGVLNTVLDFVVFWALLGLMPALLANVISFSVGAANSFVLNSVITFHDRKAESAPSSRRVLRFASVTLGCLALSSGIIFILLYVLPALYAKAVSLIATFAAGYLFNDRLVFKPSR